MGSPGPPNLLPYNCVEPDLIPKEEVDVDDIAELSPYLEAPPEEFMLEDGVFIVEKIVNKRIFGTGLNRRTEYLIKWKDFPTSQNTWEPLENLTSCPLLIEQYENKYKNGIIPHQAQTQPGNKRKRKRKRFGSGTGSNHAKKPNKEIEEILGATDCSGELMFYVRFAGNETDIVPSKILNLRNPQAVIKYYESIISLDKRPLFNETVTEETNESLPIINEVNQTKNAMLSNAVQLPVVNNEQ